MFLFIGSWLCSCQFSVLDDMVQDHGKSRIVFNLFWWMTLKNIFQIQMHWHCGLIDKKKTYFVLFLNKSFSFSNLWNSFPSTNKSKVADLKLGFLCLTNHSAVAHEPLFLPKVLLTLWARLSPHIIFQLRVWAELNYDSAPPAGALSSLCFVHTTCLPLSQQKPFSTLW